MSYSKDANNIQHMLGILLQFPDPNQMLKNSKPLDREEGQIKVIEQGTVQKYKWQGALPSKLRDEKLHLNYDRQVIKVKNSQQLQNNSQQLYHQNSASNRRDFNQMRNSNKLQNQSFSVDYRSKELMNQSRYNNNNNSLSNCDDNFGFNQNQSLIIQKNNFFDHSQTPSSTTNRKYMHQNSVLSPTHNLLSPKLNPFNNQIIQMSREKNQSNERKQISIKYIGVHNDMIGVLSRKVQMEQQVEKLTKCKQIQQERRVKSGTGGRYKPLEKPLIPQIEQSKSQVLDERTNVQKNKISINIKQGQKKNTQNGEQTYDIEEDNAGLNENHLIPMSDDSRNQLLSISQKLYEIQENIEMENKQSQLELSAMSIQENQEKKRLHQSALRQVLEEEDTQQNTLVPILPINDSRSSQENRKVENTHSTLTSTQYQRFYGNPIIKNEKNNQQLNTSYSRPSTTLNSRTYYSYVGQQTPTNTQNNRQQSQTQRSQSINQQQRKIIQNDQNVENLPESSYIHIDKSGSQYSNSQQNSVGSTQEMPDPSKYDKFIVTKYSLERKLTALKKKREDNPNYSKKQFYVVWNNQQINCLNSQI